MTPGLSRDYAARTADHQAAFLLPHLRRGMDLLDIGCGPGTITVGLADIVAPGHVTGIDHDVGHLAAARALATEEGVENVTFRPGDALDLPFADGTFDVAFENNVFLHVADDAGRAAAEARRVLKPGGIFAARDTATALWGHPVNALNEFSGLFRAWQQRRGSDIDAGPELPRILREAGFVDTIKSVSADTKGTPAEARAQAEIMTYLLDGPLGRDSVRTGLADRSTITRLRDAIRAWGAHPDAFFANVHVEVIGRNPG